MADGQVVVVFVDVECSTINEIQLIEMRLIKFTQ